MNDWEARTIETVSTRVTSLLWRSVPPDLGCAYKALPPPQVILAFFRTTEAVKLGVV